MRRIALLLVALLAIAGCGGGSVATGPVTTSPAGSTPTEAAPGRTAADDLAPYFNAAQSMDRQLAAAAVLVNGGIHTSTMQFDQATLDAITAIQPRTLAAKIPPGLPPELERRILLVQSELVSRRAAFNEVLRGTAGNAYVVRCLANGAPAAARFASDLAAGRSLAAQTPPVAAQPQNCARGGRPDDHAAVHRRGQHVLRLMRRSAPDPAAPHLVGTHAGLGRHHHGCGAVPGVGREPSLSGPLRARNRMVGRASRGLTPDARTCTVSRWHGDRRQAPAAPRGMSQEPCSTSAAAAQRPACAAADVCR